MHTKCDNFSKICNTINTEHKMNNKLSWYSDLLQAGRSRDQILVVARFSVPIQTGPGAHPASYTMGTGSFSELKQLGRGIDHPTPSKAEVNERVGLYSITPLDFRGLF
jgi:hypothetical protein